MTVQQGGFTCEHMSVMVWDEASICQSTESHLQLRRVGGAPAVGLDAHAGLHPRQRPPKRALRQRAHRGAEAAFHAFLAATLREANRLR